MSWMREALELAEKGRYTCAPNPMVGCVIVKEGQVVGRGWHQRAGEAHAEALALREAGGAAVGSDLYVTLEPCCHHGRTPPCVEAVIRAGVRRVHVATLDPNPLMNGEGARRLKEKGIDVVVGECGREALELNEAFFRYITTRRPFVVAKWAMSLDGALGRVGEQVWLTGEKARAHVHGLRQSLQAIMVGAETVRVDDPQLTVRAVDEVKRQPVRIVVTGSGELALSSQVFDGKAPTLVFTTERAERRWVDALLEKGVDCHVLAEENGRIDIDILLQEIGSLGILSLLLEGGPHLLSQFLEQGLVQQIVTYLSPQIMGGGVKLSPFEVGEEKFKVIETVGLSPDVCMVLKKVKEEACLTVL